MARLAAAFLLRLASPRGRLGVRMLRARGQGGVLRVQAQACLQFADPAQQRLNEGADRRRHLGVEFRRDRDRMRLGGRHDACRPKKRRLCPDPFSLKTAPTAGTVTPDTRIPKRLCDAFLAALRSQRLCVSSVGPAAVPGCEHLPRAPAVPRITQSYLVCAYDGTTPSLETPHVWTSRRMARERLSTHRPSSSAKLSAP
jgi:hypothetical protein